MARTPATNYSSPGYSYATADTDAFDRLDVAGMGQSVDTHDHSSGKGLPIAAAAIPSGSITSAMIQDGTIQATDIATGTITTTQIADGTIATADLANAAVTNAKLGTDTARLNLLTNGGFEIWQRGNGPFTVNGTFPGDMWRINLFGTDTMSVVRDTTNIDVSSKAASACTFVLGTGAGTSSIFQQIAVSGDHVGLAGRTLTLSVRVRTSTANAVRIGMNNYYSSTAHWTYSPFHTGDGTWQTLTVSGPCDLTATYFQPNVLFNASCTAYLDNAMLVVGSVAADYAPLHPADDLARCLRYYETTWPISGVTVAVGQAVNANTAYAGLIYKVRKAVTPTITFAGTWAVTQASGTQVGATPAAAAATTPDGFQMGLTSASGLVAGNATLFVGNSASSAVVAEANP